MNKKLISIITPCFNEEDGILDCYKTIKEIFEIQLPQYTYEHIFCDNASLDQTVNLLKALAINDRHVKIIINSRNFGILKNTFNGVMNSNGDAVLLFMPVDMQDPPSLIPDFIKKWEDGYEIVYGIRAEREESFFMSKSRKIYYRLLSKLTYVDYPVDVGDFQLVDRCVINTMKQYDDAQPFMRLMTFDCGFRSFGIPYTWKVRAYGKSQNNLIHMFNQGLNGIVSFSGIPLRVALFGGFLLATLSLLYAIIIFFVVIFGNNHGQSGIPTIIVALFFFGGVLLFFLGVLGEYILAIYNQFIKKPLVVERERVNFD